MKRIKIMVVDDNKDVLFSVKEGLMSISNYEIQTVISGEKCMEILESGDLPDLILLDIMMPGIDGWEVASRIKQNKKLKNLPLIFLTAKTDELSRGLGSLTSDDYVGKPFEMVDLKERIDRVLAKHYKL
ncbi:MAG: response regulator [Candidatus Nanohalarchaeota archaeon]|nr:MAG: response regulator [Candidatus Nanohaloarchaeota archaeon]